MKQTRSKVLIVTGSLTLSSGGMPGTSSQMLKTQRDLFKAYQGAWLDVRLKLEIAELLLKFKLELNSAHFRKAAYHDIVKAYFRSPNSLDVPELTEVSLATLLQREGIDYQVMSVNQACAINLDKDRRFEQCKYVFLSSTLLRDLNELELVAAWFKRPDNKVIAGGALTGFVWQRWHGSPWIDVLAVGYGEYLVPALADWIKNDMKHLEAPPGGRIERRGKGIILCSGLPLSKNLDELPTPDWQLAQQYHQREFPLVLYESVRGCPYRCGFCNYPYLFNDSQFRTRSAEKIAEDWEKLAYSGVKLISCLDSLFTVPRRRLERLCHLLLFRDIQVKWICFARADDLLDPEICGLMREAGCVKVAVGIESGSQKILDNMNKRCSVDNNSRALQNCRNAGLVTSTSLIVGYPGETQRTVRETFDFLNINPPDIFHVYTLSIRAEGLPVLAAANRTRFSLEIHDDGRTAQPYWRHESMSCNNAVDYARWLRISLIQQQVALEGTLFYANSLDWNINHRKPLLEFQKDVVTRHPVINWLAGKADRFASWQLERDMYRRMSDPSQVLV